MNSKNRFIGFIKSIGYNVKNYQVNGFEWCYNREKTGGGLLCYEMGLGKTILMLSCIKLNPKIRTLIVLPKALISQWVEKVRAILNIEPYLYTSSLKFKNMDSNTVMRILNSQSVIITSYGMITERAYKGRNILSPLWKIKWSRVIYDEAHNMRNSYSKLYMGAMKINSEIFWMMTGTPIQNRWGDVVSLCMLSKIKPLIDGIKSRSTEKMITLLKHYMLYNTKKNVNIKMPKLNLHIHKIPFKNQEKDISEDIHEKLDLVCLNTTREKTDLLKYMHDSWFAYACRAKQVCIYPKLLKKCVDNYLNDNDNDDEMNSLDESRDKLKLPNFNSLDNSKIRYLIQLINKSDRTKKKIIFCSYTNEAIRIKQLLSSHYCIGILNGSTTKNMRRVLLTNKNIDVLIIQIQCGSDGLNLQHYQEIYFTSPHWNPAVEQQAIGRIYRIGQKSESVDIHSLVSEFDVETGKTIDEYCLEVQKKKQVIINQLFDSVKNDKNTSFNLKNKKKKKLKIVEKYSKK